MTLSRLVRLAAIDWGNSYIRHWPFIAATIRVNEQLGYAFKVRSCYDVVLIVRSLSRVPRIIIDSPDFVTSVKIHGMKRSDILATGGPKNSENPTISPPTYLAIHESFPEQADLKQTKASNSSVCITLTYHGQPSPAVREKRVERSLTRLTELRTPIIKRNKHNKKDKSSPPSDALANCATEDLFYVMEFPVDMTSFVSSPHSTALILVRSTPPTRFNYVLEPHPPYSHHEKELTDYQLPL
ncbi:hypothetical protein B0H66DRAFT_538400 [Apodospora peruviana]|uniref:Uncharacterized protein n=1 Tax=Apodospora peruviana TaxID=516989 RepID=A0AAE0LYB3_9PEZI|nr:hypothetical protein B0H66DRAFT_538400 [Apodospora peruviana]